MFCASTLTRCLPATARSLSPVPPSSPGFRRAVWLVGCFAVLLLPSLTRAQSPGALDTTFTAQTLGSTIYALFLQTTDNQKNLVLGGDNAAFDELSLSGDDTENFNLSIFGNASGRIIYTIVPELVINGTGSPKLLLGGLFGRSAEQITEMEPAQNIVRILPDGSLDPAFNPGKGSDNYVTAILPLADGGMLVGGQFVLFNSINHQHIVRLDNTGAIVPSTVFDPKLAFDDTVLYIAPQVNPDPTGLQGQSLVAGVFSNVNGQAHHGLARINADGSVDTSFTPNFGDRVTVAVSQPDGKILVGGYFETVNGTAVKHLVRLNYDGSLDSTFNAQVTTMPPLIAAAVAVNTITPVGDGRYYIGGNFAEIDGVKRNYLGRVNPDGSVDDFDPGTAITNAVQQAAVDYSTNEVYVGETLSKEVNMVYPPSVIRLFGDPLPEPKVSVTASEVTGLKGQHGVFTFIRTKAKVTQPLNVYVTLGGTAVEQPTATSATGDFHFSPRLAAASDIDGETTRLVTFPSGVATVNITARTAKNLVGARTVVLTLRPDPNSTDPYTETYTVGKRPAATVTVSR